MYPQESTPSDFFLPPFELTDFDSAGVTEIETLPISGCEVTEFDQITGEREWNDSILVQDFAESLRRTIPMPLDYEVE